MHVRHAIGMGMLGTGLAAALTVAPAQAALAAAVPPPVATTNWHTAADAGVHELSAHDVSAHELSARSLAQCTGHHANTAVWVICDGGSQKSWVRMGYRCDPGRMYHTKWYLFTPGKRLTTSAECTVRAVDAWANVRPY